jgi:hypothetical protein
MKQRALALAALAGVAIGLLIWTDRYAGVPLGLWIYVFASLTSQIFDILLALMLAVALAIGLVRLAGGRGGQPSPVLNFLSWGGPLFGLLAGAREGSIIWVAIQMTHTTSFRVVAPTVAEALLMPVLGLLAGAVAAAFASAPTRA